MNSRIKHIVLLVVTGIYCLTFLRTLTPYVDYVVNQDFIAEVLCVNQDKPELQCNGKCYLKDRIEEEAQQEQQDQQSNRSLEKELLFIAQFEEKLQWESFPLFTTTYFADPVATTQEWTFDIPKPPPQV